MDKTTKPHQRPTTLISDHGNMPVPLSIDFPLGDDIFSCIWGTFSPEISDEQFNLGHMCYSVQMSNINMVTTDEIRDYLNTLNSMDIIWLRGILVDKKASLIRQNLQPSHEPMVVLDLLREQIHNRFEWIQIILVSVPELMDKIRN